MRRISLYVLATSLLAACGASTTATRRPLAATSSGRAGDAAYVVVRRPLAGRVHLLLALDAGTRDASPPPVATLTAWLLARAVGTDADGFAAPDLVGVSLDCATSELRGCTSRLFAALARHEVDGAALGALRRRLHEAHERVAGDEVRRADALAISAALGDDAVVDALGRPEDEATLDAAHVRAFLDAHAGRDRALLVAVGDVDERAVRDATEAAAAGAPQAGLRAAPDRAPRSRAAEAAATRTDAAGDPSATRADAPAPRAGGSVAVARSAAGIGATGELRVEAGDADAASVALLVASPRRAAGVAAALPLAEVVSLRGASLVLARGTDLRTLVRAVATAAVESAEVADGATTAPHEDEHDDVRETARAAAVAWASHGSAGGDAADGPLTAGAVMRVAADDAPAAAALQARAASAYVAGLADAAPALRGTLDASAASVVATNGARIETRRRAGTEGFALALRFAGDAGAEPRTMHGRTHILAEALAHRCDDTGRGAAVTATVGASSFGVDVRARDRVTLDRALLCALTVVPDAGDVARGGVAIVDGDARARLLAASARLLAPETPGLIAPAGDARAVPVPSPEEVRATLTAARTGARVSIAVVGDAAADELARHAGRRAAVLAAGSAAGELEAGPAAASDLLAAPSADGATHVVLAWRTGDAPAAGATRDDARAVALALTRTLAERPGVRVRAAVGDVTAPVAFVALAIDVDDDALDALPATWAAATTAARDARTLADAHDAVARDAALALATPAGEAAMLAERRLRPGSPHGADLVAFATRLLAAAPRVEIARARPATPPRAAPVLVRPPRARPVVRPRRRAR